MSLEGGPHPSHAVTNDPSEWTRGCADGDTVRGGHLGEKGARDDGLIGVRIDALAEEHRDPLGLSNTYQHRLTSNRVSL